jgi:threonine dehydratase
MSHVVSAAASVAEVVRPTTVIESGRLSERLGAEITIVSETFQYTGSFKFRAAYGLASRVPNEKILTESSGNFGQALAYACKLLGKSCTVVMPSTSAQVKVDAVREFGGVVELTDVRVKSRAERLRELAAEFPDAYVASAFNSPLVIDGNSTLGVEICKLDRSFDAVIVPVGGGGLSSGIIKGIESCGRKVPVVGAEPLIANDAARSIKEGRIVSNEHEPQTIADGARVISIGEHNWEVLRHGLSTIVEVPEERIMEGLRLLFSFANLKSEPTGALSIGALLTEPERFKGKQVCCVVSGGNVNPEVYSGILLGVKG